MEVIYITAVQVDVAQSKGFYVDDDGILRSVALEYGEASAIARELHDGSLDSVGIEVSPRSALAN